MDKFVYSLLGWIDERMNFLNKIVDDVYTTGTSFREFISETYPMWTMQQGFRWCVFARRPSDTMQGGFVKALFTMPTANNQYD